MPSDSEFGAAAAQAVSEQSSGEVENTSEGGAPSQEGTQEPAGEVLKLAETLKSIGVTPETAREQMQRLAFYQTPQGQAEYWNNYLTSEAGRQARERFGREHLAAVLSQPDGPERMYGLLKEWGYKPSAPDDEPEAPEAREVRAVKAQQAALDRKLQELTQGNQQLQQRLAAREQQDQEIQAFVAWAGERPKLADKAYTAVAARARELARLYPDQYRGPAGFKAAATDALNQYTNVAPVFAPKPRPRGLGTGGGGVAGKGGVDTSKLSLKEQISLEAENFAAAVRESEQE